DGVDWTVFDIQESAGFGAQYGKSVPISVEFTGEGPQTAQRLPVFYFGKVQICRQNVLFVGVFGDLFQLFRGGDFVVAFSIWFTGRLLRLILLRIDLQHRTLRALIPLPGGIEIPAEVFDIEFLALGRIGGNNAALP